MKDDPTRQVLVTYTVDKHSLTRHAPLEGPYYNKEVDEVFQTKDVSDYNWGRVRIEIEACNGTSRSTTIPEYRQFLGHTAQHELTVIRDDGLYRHIRLKKDGTLNRYFDLITVPGRLFYCGDMGSYSFARDKDMFEFFRIPADECIKPNYSYWLQKMESQDRIDGAHVYSPEMAKESVLHHLEAHTDDAVPAALSKEVHEQILTADNDRDLIDALDSFTHNGEYVFQDAWDWLSCMDLSYRLKWAMHAIPWAIRQYDKATTKGEQLQ